MRNAEKRIKTEKHNNQAYQGVAAALYIHMHV